MTILILTKQISPQEKLHSFFVVVFEHSYVLTVFSGNTLFKMNVKTHAEIDSKEKGSPPYLSRKLYVMWAQRNGDWLQQGRRRHAAADWRRLAAVADDGRRIRRGRRDRRRVRRQGHLDGNGAGGRPGDRDRHGDCNGHRDGHRRGIRYRRRTRTPVTGSRWVCGGVRGGGLGGERCHRSQSGRGRGLLEQDGDKCTPHVVNSLPSPQS